MTMGAYIDHESGAYAESYNKLDVGNIVPFEIQVMAAVAENDFATIDLRKTKNVLSREPFVLDDSFIAEFEGKEPEWGELGWFTFKRTYARRVEKVDGTSTRTEEWTEVVRRVVEGNLSIIPEDPLTTQEYGQTLYKLIWNLVWTPPGRGLWMSGSEFAKKSGDAMNNCLKGTERVFVKDVGLVPISELCGETEVLSDGGVYRTADFRSFGVQELMKITFQDGQEVFATPEHKWIVLSGNSGERKKDRIDTKDLQAGDKIPVIRPNVPSSIDEEGLAHGFIFGDGTRIPNGYCRAPLFESKIELLGMLAKYGRVADSKIPTVTNLPFHFKKIPKIDEHTPEYLLGFIIGYLSADGHVRGTDTRLHCKDEYTLEAVRDIAAYIGLKVNPVRLVRETSPYTGEIAPLYSVSFSAETLPGHLFPRSDQRDKFREAKRVAKVPYKEIKSVEYTGIREEVFCCNEPETHSFVIEGHLLTSNCWFVSTRPWHYGKDTKIIGANEVWRNGIEVRPSEADLMNPRVSYSFVFLFDMAMKGGGVGFSVEDEDLETLPDVRNKVELGFFLSEDHADYPEVKAMAESLGAPLNQFFAGRVDVEGVYVEVSDSREGWADSLAMVVDEHFRRPGETVYLGIDLSKIRERGTPIRGFGGVASGSAPLLQLLHFYNMVFNKFVGKRLTSEAGTDLHNSTGKCVVAGNVRRTAEVALASPYDQSFIDLKNYTLYSWLGGWRDRGDGVWEQYENTDEELLAQGYSQEEIDEARYQVFAQQNHRWASNNSVVVDDPRGYKWGFISPGIEANGEPGILNRWLMQNFGRVIDGYRKMLDKARGGNPCFRGDMRLLTSEGYKTFTELDGQKVSIINKDGVVSHGKVWCSGEKPTVEIKFHKKASIFCTEDHVFMLNDGTERTARNLKGERIMPFLSEPHEFVFIKDFVQMGFMQGDGQLTRLKSSTHKGIEVNIGKDDKYVLHHLFGLTEEDLLKDGRNIYVTEHFARMNELGFSAEPLPTRVFPASYDAWTHEAKKSFLRGMYSANGSVVSSKAKSTVRSRVTYKTVCIALAEKLVQTLTDDFGLSPYITVNKSHDVEFSNGTYELKQSYDVNLAKHEDQVAFFHTIGFVQPYKNLKLRGLLVAGAPKVRNVVPTGVTEKVYDFTEPLVHWGVVEGVIAHNCMEISLESGEPCNLTELFLPVMLKLGIDPSEVLPLMVHYTKRVTFSPYEWEQSRNVITENRRLGISFSGFADWVLLKYGKGAISGWRVYKKEAWDDMVWLTDTAEERTFAYHYGNVPPSYDPEIDVIEPDYNPELVAEIDRMYKIVKQADIEYSAILTKALGYEVRPSLKLTTVKPSGTVALLPFVSPGVHHHYFRYGIRRIQVQSNDPLLGLCQLAGYKTEPYNKSPETTSVIEFPVKAPTADFEDFRDCSEVTIEEQFALQALLCIYWADNMVSCTITFHDHEKPKIRHLLEQYRMRIKSTSLLPYSGHGYVQAPYQQYEWKDGKSPKEQYEEARKSITWTPHELYHTLMATGDFQDREMSLSEAIECAGGACPVR